MNTIDRHETRSFGGKMLGSPMRRGFAVAALSALTGAGGCDFMDDLVDVDAADRITASTYESPENAAILMAGVVADFECALASYIVGAGVAGDELMITDALTAPELLDKRQWETRGLGAAWGVSTCSGRSEGTPGIYRPLSTARWQADNLLRLLEGWASEDVTDRDFLMAKAAAYAGYGLILLGEVMCEVPLDMGPAMSADAIFAEAEDRFQRAMTAAAAAGAPAEEFLNMARVGLARARLNRGDLSGAAQAAAVVPAGFVKHAVYSTVSPRRYNVIFQDVQGNTITVGPAYRDVAFEGAADPRIPVFDTGRLASGIPLWDQSKFESRADLIEIATYTEAQLILAEAAVAEGRLQEAVDIINSLHTAAGIPHFSSSEPDEIMDRIIRERQAEFFLEGHRFGDIRRYVEPLIPAPGTPYHTGGTYTDSRCFPIPGIEIDANPNING